MRRADSRNHFGSDAVAPQALRSQRAGAQQMAGIKACRHGTRLAPTEA
jgi:hypothetical protein